MKISFRTLEALIGRMTEQQKDQLVVADIVDGINSRTTLVSLAISDENTMKLNEGQPYFLIESPEISQNLASSNGYDIDTICRKIGL